MFRLLLAGTWIKEPLGSADANCKGLLCAESSAFADPLLWKVDIRFAGGWSD
jgi:hypothetical protein